MTIAVRRVPPMLPGQYSKRGSGTVALACPCCGVISLLDYPFRISDSGVVAPRWLCERCNWTDELQLVDFKEETVG